MVLPYCSLFVDSPKSPFLLRFFFLTNGFDIVSREGRDDADTGPHLLVTAIFHFSSSSTVVLIPRDSLVSFLQWGGLSLCFLSDWQTDGMLCLRKIHDIYSIDYFTLKEGEFLSLLLSSLGMNRKGLRINLANRCSWAFITS